MNHVRLILRAAAWLSIVAVFLITISPIQYRPTTGFPNVERFCVMAAVGALFVAAYPKRFWLILIGLSLATAIFEPMQMLAYGRHASLHDVDFKVFGVLVGVTLGFAFNHVLLRLQPGTK